MIVGQALRNSEMADDKTRQQAAKVQKMTYGQGASGSGHGQVLGGMIAVPKGGLDKMKKDYATDSDYEKQGKGQMDR